MSERWHREVQKLRDVEPGPEVWDDARTRTPEGDGGLPPTRQRLVAGVVAFAVFVGAGFFVWQSFRPSAPLEPIEPAVPSATIVMEGNHEGPSASLSFDGSVQEAVFDSYRWCATPDDCTEVTNDLAYPPLDDGITMVVGTPIDFEGGRVERFVIRTTEGDRESANVVVDADGTDAAVPDEPGDYLIWIAADWDQGSGAFYLRVRATALETNTPNAIAITCTPDGTEVPPTAVVTPQGPRFTVDNQSGAAQVLIAGVSGDARQNAADIDLSQSTTHTFDIPPGDYVVGCFQDRVEGPGGADAWSGLPGMVPVSILDPNETYVPSLLMCGGQGAGSSFGLAEVPFDSTPEDAIRIATDGIEDTDVIEASGYPDNQGQIGSEHQMFNYRLVRDQATLALFRVTTVADGNPFVVDVTACDGTGIEPRKPSGPSPTPVGG